MHELPAATQQKQPGPVGPRFVISYALGYPGTWLALSPAVVTLARGTTSGALGLCLPVGVVAGTYLVQLVAPRSSRCSPWSARELAHSFSVVLAGTLGGKLSDVIARRKIFVVLPAVFYGLALLLIATATDFGDFLVGMAVAGLGLGVYVAVDLALVTEVLDDPATAGKYLGVFIAPAILTLGDGSYTILYSLAAIFPVLCAIAVLPVRRVR